MDNEQGKVQELVDKIENNTINIEEEMKNKEQEDRLKDEVSSSYSSDTMRTKKHDIIKNLIEPAYEQDIKSNLSWRYTWRNISNFSEGTGQIITMIGAGLSFAAGTLDNKWFAFASGCCVVMSLGLNKFSKYASSESKERTQSLNIVLKHLGMKHVPIIIQDGNNELNKNMSIVSTNV